MVKDALHSEGVVCVAVIRAEECLFFYFPEVIRRSQCAIWRNSVKVTRVDFLRQVKGLRAVTIMLVLLFKAHFSFNFFFLQSLLNQKNSAS